MEWDGWGFAGAGDTTVYLVFDPSDLLLTEAGDHSSGKFAGIPCEVPLVHRLEDHWYTVLFHTDSDWHAHTALPHITKPATQIRRIRDRIRSKHRRLLPEKNTMRNDRPET